jgi:gamma-glutamylcyclotransferase (GGCT)/AIG2-like uncharacterized protein YtfP
MYYFAYGSNLSHKQMAERCPGSKFVGPATLDDYELVFDGYHERRKGAIANIVPAEGKQVVGGVYELTNEDLSSLDRYEEYPVTYGREAFRVKMFDDTAQEAMTYLRPPQPIGEPSEEYLDVINTGKKDCEVHTS